MNEDELRKRMMPLSREAGFYKGLLEGLLLQCENTGQGYYLSDKVFNKVNSSFEKAKKDFGS